MAVDTGVFLRTVRQRHHLTQHDLARLAHTQQSAISRVENGRVSPTVKTLDTWLAAMGDHLAVEATVAKARVGTAW